MKQNPSVLGIDLAKRVLHVVGMDEMGHNVLKKRLTRDALLPFIAPLPPLVIGMDACGGAHYWARRFREHGHTRQRLAPKFVQPYVKSNTKDPGDAEASCEAVTRRAWAVAGVLLLTRVADRRGLAQVDRQCGVQRPFEHPLGARIAPAMRPEDSFGVGIIFEQCLSQGVVFGLRTGHLLLLMVGCLKDNQ